MGEGGGVSLDTDLMRLGNRRRLVTKTSETKIGKEKAEKYSRLRVIVRLRKIYRLMHFPKYISLLYLSSR